MMTLKKWYDGVNLNIMQCKKIHLIYFMQSMNARALLL